MEIALIIIGTCLLLLIKIVEFGAEREAKRDGDEESKRPPVHCDVCHQPNKAEGACTAKRITEAGPRKLKVCDDCLREYRFCSQCGDPATLTFHTYLGGSYCQMCFESIPRSFSSTREAALAYHGRVCDICGSTRNLNVHNKTYAREVIEQFDDLVVLCRHCHNLQHTSVHTGPRGGKYITRQKKKWLFLKLSG